MRPDRKPNAILLVIIVMYAAVLGVFGCGCCFFTGSENLSPQELEAQEWIKKLGGEIETAHVPRSGWIAPHVVDLAGTKVRDDELHHLRKLAPSLLSLDLSETGIDGSGMPKLADIAEAGSISLSLRRTMVTDKTLARFIRGARISYLDLSDTCITDDGVEGLITADIGILDLSGTRVTGAGIRRLKNIAYLRQVRLRRLPLSDDDIPALTELAEKKVYLRILDLRDTGLSESDIRRLRDTLRGLHIITDILFESAK